jgi:hypothetical protein
MRKRDEVRHLCSVGYVTGMSYDSSTIDLELDGLSIQ